MRDVVWLHLLVISQASEGGTEDFRPVSLEWDGLGRGASHH